jgi:hypothetical protein
MTNEAQTFFVPKDPFLLLRPTALFVLFLSGILLGVGYLVDGIPTSKEKFPFWHVQAGKLRSIGLGLVFFGALGLAAHFMLLRAFQ